MFGAPNSQEGEPVVADLFVFPRRVCDGVRRDAVTARQGTDATLADVSKLIHKNPTWIRQQLDLPLDLPLDLLGLRADIQKAVERGEIPLQSVYMLAKLPRVRQVQFINLAKTTPMRDFVPVVARLVKQIQKAARQGRLRDYCQDFEPVAYLRP